MARFAYQPTTPMGLARAGRLTQSEINPGAVGHAYIVDGLTEESARSAGRLAMIADGMAPGTILHLDIDESGTGRWEVVMTHRALKAGETFRTDGTRISTGGTHADRYVARDEWSYGR